MKHFTYALIGLSAFLVNALPLQAMADENDVTETGMFGTALTDDRLATNRGGHNLELNTNNVNGKLYDNQATSNVTGSNNITTGAFSGSSGMSTVIQNSGNNVLIQSATILNIKLQ